ncbi:helicase-related protein [Desulfoluna sp.]|uniref:DEAD/DEAH box helicase n=1 Tax=Desulfoluna sp. TaxID=2045199 RepID=UPI002628F2D1|nr:helicase-related protein [Desulfoluna sp.]
MKLNVLPRTLDTPAPNEELGIQGIFKHIIDDDARNRQVVDDISAAFSEGRKILVLTERAAHLKTLQERLRETGMPHVTLYGRMSRKKREDALKRLESLSVDEPRLLLATGKLIGEGFDHPPLDTLVLAMPISWKGTLQQYAGRLHRLEKGKKDIRIYDYVDHEIAPLKRMWNKRCKGYKAMGYEIGSSQEMFLFDE